MLNVGAVARMPHPALSKRMATPGARSRRDFYRGFWQGGAELKSSPGRCLSGFHANTKAFEFVEQVHCSIER